MNTLETILLSLSGTGALIAILAYLSKSLLTTFLSKDLENHKTELKAKSELAIEEFKSSLTLESQKRIIEYSSLHTKRAELVAELYGKLNELEGIIRRLQYEYMGREIREDLDQKYYKQKREEWELVDGIHSLTDSEGEKVKLLHNALMEFWPFYSKNRIYFPTTVCTLIDKYSGLASFVAGNYHNIALKDNDGNLYVAPVVKNVWDGAERTMPEVLRMLVVEFRSLLGVESDAS